MNKSEASKVVQMLVDAYPQSSVSVGTMAIYREALMSLSFQAARAVVLELVCETKFMPSIAEIRTKVEELKAREPRKIEQCATCGGFWSMDGKTHHHHSWCEVG